MIATEQFIDAVVDSCAEIFEMMLPMSLSEKMSQRPLPFEFPDPPNSEDDIIASIGLTGDCSGTISLFLSVELGLQMAGWLMEETYTELNSEVFESVGEIVNLIAGGLKNRLSTEDKDIFNLSIPIVISGKEKKIFHGKDKEYIVMPIDTDQGMFFVTLVLDQH